MWTITIFERRFGKRLVGLICWLKLQKKSISVVSREKCYLESPAILSYQFAWHFCGVFQLFRAYCLFPWTSQCSLILTSLAWGPHQQSVVISEMFQTLRTSSCQDYKIGYFQKCLTTSSKHEDCCCCIVGQCNQTWLAVGEQGGTGPADGWGWGLGGLRAGLGVSCPLSCTTGLTTSGHWTASIGGYHTHTPCGGDIKQNYLS